jgi:hypothetical protein
VTGTDEQILKGIRGLRGYGTEGVFNDLIKDVNKQILAVKSQISELEMSLDLVKETRERSGIRENNSVHVMGYGQTLAAQLKQKRDLLEDLEIKLVAFTKAKERELSGIQVNKY